VDARDLAQADLVDFRCRQVRRGEAAQRKVVELEPVR
jgi:hypothetical protein